ncbi:MULTISPECIES: hypothetical protein [Stenotrophomonas]|uniref:hypothetical protein n=1 Tax=Stenotrophomonas TaxID=40323 RepID=UPI0012E39B47|nr:MULTISPECIES: hypothetical protein [Stenotrophomonas]
MNGPIANGLRSALLMAAMGLASVASAEQTEARANDQLAVIRSQGAVLHFDGRIAPESVGKVRAFLDADHALTELAIRSGGGDVEAGMALGRMIHDRRMDVRVVGDICMSSCANYVFPAGRHKVVESGALVIWHGSMLQKNLREGFDYSGIEKQLGRPLNWLERWSMRRTANRWFRRVSVEQVAFYGKIGVDPAITVLGQEQGCACNWTVPVADMAKFGIGSVSADTDYAAPGYARWDGEWQLITRIDEAPTATRQ